MSEVTQLRVLVLGATGMLGSAIFRTLSEDGRYKATGTVRSRYSMSHYPEHLHSSLITDVDADRPNSLENAFLLTAPDVVINCIGIIKHLEGSQDPLTVLPVNSLLPHRLARISKIAKARFIHISTDCVYNGMDGGYQEADKPNASDLYGISKALGEVKTEGSLTIRTSIVGPELSGKTSLLEWFLSQKGVVQGYTKAVFSGLPTNELAEIIKDYVIPNHGLSGLYNVSSSPIDKYTLLNLIKSIYEKTDVEIVKSESVVVNRSLNSKAFSQATGYVAPDWPVLIQKMRKWHRLTRQIDGKTL